MTAKKTRPQPGPNPAYEKPCPEGEACATSGSMLSPEPVNAIQRLTRIEALLGEVLGELRARRRRNGKRVRTVAQNAYLAAVNDNDNAPSELEIAAARRILRKRSQGR